MATYLIVAHQTAGSNKLGASLQALLAENAAAEFVLLVPATRAIDLIIPAEGFPNEIAWRRARAAGQHLESIGIPIAGVEVGDESPLAAIGHELQRTRRSYDAIVIGTYQLGASRWLRQDLVKHVEKRFGLPVIHVVTKAPLRRPGSVIRLPRSKSKG